MVPQCRDAVGKSVDLLGNPFRDSDSHGRRWVLAAAGVAAVVHPPDS